jgi:hypothetical protein
MRALQSVVVWQLKRSFRALTSANTIDALKMSPNIREQSRQLRKKSLTAL